jgi:hypothetical protein
MQTKLMRELLVAVQATKKQRRTKSEEPASTADVSEEALSDALVFVFKKHPSLTTGDVGKREVGVILKDFLSRLQLTPALPAAYYKAPFTEASTHVVDAHSRRSLTHSRRSLCLLLTYVKSISSSNNCSSC